jgi:hypothetical protein
MASKTGEREALEREALDAMRAADRLPEPAVIRHLPDEVLQAIIARYTGPLLVA